MGLGLQAAIILKEVNPQLFLIGGIWVLLIGLGLLALAAYLTLKHPVEMKRSRWLRRYKDTDWAQYLAGGVVFAAMGGVFILSALDGLGREMSDIEVGLGRGLLIVAAVGFIVLFIIKVAEKFNE
jgi:hypothetical protein